MPLRLLLLASDRLGLALAGAGVGVSALAANGQTGTVTQTAVGPQVHEPLDVHRGFAAKVAFRFPELFRGIALASVALKSPPPEHSPEFQFQFHLIYGDRDPAGPFVQKTAAGLSRLKFPVTLRKIEGHRAGYPSADAVEEMARWLDALDRL